MIPDYHFISGFGSVYIQFTQNKITEHCPDSQVVSQQEPRIRICCSLSINIVNACFDHRYITAGITTETNFDLIVSCPDDDRFQVIILFLVSAQCISSSLKNRITEHYPDSQVISQQESRTYLLLT